MMAIARTMSFDDNSMWVTLEDGRVVGVPIAWFPRLLKATQEQRMHYEIFGGGTGIHWPEIDEDISVAGLLAGRGDQTQAAFDAA